MRRVGCLIMSRKLPPAAAALGFVRTICQRLCQENILSEHLHLHLQKIIDFLNLAFTKMEFRLKVTCSGSIGFPFILLASARTFLASSMRPLIGGEIQLGRPSACHDFLASIILLRNHHHHRHHHRHHHHLTLQSTISGTPGARREELHPQPPWRR